MLGDSLVGLSPSAVGLSQLQVVKGAGDRLPLTEVQEETRSESALSLRRQLLSSHVEEGRLALSMAMVQGSHRLPRRMGPGLDQRKVLRLGDCSLTDPQGLRHKADWISEHRSGL